MLFRARAAAGPPDDPHQRHDEQRQSQVDDLAVPVDRQRDAAENSGGEIEGQCGLHRRHASGQQPVMNVSGVGLGDLPSGALATDDGKGGVADGQAQRDDRHRE